MDRSYGEGVEKALFMLSRGFCYSPGCRRPVVVLEGADEPRVDVQIAHVCAINNGGARYEDKTFELHERNMFKNLLLLCKPHHDDIDNIRTRANYPVTLLLKWKHKREGALGQQLRGLSNVTEASLEKMFGTAITEVRSELLTAINGVASANANAAQLLRDMVMESFNRPYIDPDVVASLDASARSLMVLYEYGPALHHASNAFDYLAEYGHSLGAFAQALQEHGPALGAAGNALGHLQEWGHTLSPFAQAVQGLGNGIPGSYEFDQEISRADAAADKLAMAAATLAGLGPTVAAAHEAADQLRYYQQGQEPVERKRLIRNGAYLGAGIVVALQILAVVLLKSV